jgi:glycosyltransferase involved in cell wall biosynthesis
MKLSVIIPCFNEKPTILKAIEEAKQLRVNKEIIIIDNCSIDGTRELLQNLNDDSMRIILQPRNFGVGRSLQVGCQLASGDYCYFPCADLEYTMSDVYEMIKKLQDENLDAVFGSRLLDKKHISKISLIKERPFWLGSLIATFLIDKFYRKDFTDVIAPKLIKTSIIKNLGCVSNNQAFEFELASRLCKKGFKIAEVPIKYRPRTHKQGKTIRVMDMLPALWVILKIKLFG